MEKSGPITEDRGALHVLFALRNLMYLRNYGSTIRELVRRGHRVTIVCDTSHEKITPDIKSAARDLAACAGVEIVPAPPARRGLWTDLKREIRLFRDCARYVDPRLAFSRKCSARAESMLYPPLRRLLGGDEVEGWPWAKRFSRAAAQLDKCLPAPRHWRAILQRYAPDVAVVTPVVDFNADQSDLLKAARTVGIPCAHAVASWDNLTNKGLLQIEPDRMFVWNEAQKEEAYDLHDFPPDHVVVTGAQLFDAWFERRPSRDRRSFCATVGLDADKQFILYTCSSVFIARHESEFVARWLHGLRASPDPSLRDAGVLIRPHPGSTKHAAQWEAEDIVGVPQVAVYPAAGGYPVTMETQADLFDSLYHAGAVVGINTSVMLEAAIVGRRTLTVLDPAFSETQGGMLHFRHLQRPGSVKVAKNFTEHFAQLGEALDGSAETAPETEEFVRFFLRPRGIDKPATGALADAIQDLAAVNPKPFVLPWYASLVRAGLVLPACWLWTVNWRRTTKKWNAKYTVVGRLKTWLAVQLGMVDKSRRSGFRRGD